MTGVGWRERCGPGVPNVFEDGNTHTGFPVKSVSITLGNRDIPVWGVLPTLFRTEILTPATWAWSPEPRDSSGCVERHTPDFR
jgi:hypothetical protein